MVPLPPRVADSLYSSTGPRAETKLGLGWDANGNCWAMNTGFSKLLQIVCALWVALRARPHTAAGGLSALCLLWFVCANAGIIGF